MQLPNTRKEKVEVLSFLMEKKFWFLLLKKRIYCLILNSHKVKLTSISLILICFLFPKTDVIGEYIITSKSKGDKLLISLNNKFLYENRGYSCWLWRDIKGVWQIKKDTLILFENRIIYKLNDNGDKVIKERKEIIKHKYKITNEGIISIETDFTEKNTFYKKTKNYANN